MQGTAVRGPKNAQQPAAPRSMKRITTLTPRQNLIVAAAVRAVADEASQDVLARSIRRPRRSSPFGNPRVCAFVV
jgi:hypothetical protein